MQLLMLRLDSYEDGMTALNDIERRRKDKQIILEDLALLYRNKKGKAKIAQTSDATGGKGLARGGGVGLLLGILTPAMVVPSLVWGAVIGGVIAKVGDKGIQNDFMKSVASALEANESVLIALGPEEQIGLLGEGIREHAGQLEFMVVPAETQELMREIAKLPPEVLDEAMADV